MLWWSDAFRDGRHYGSAITDAVVAQYERCKMNASMVWAWMIRLYPALSKMEVTGMDAQVIVHTRG